MDEQERAVRRQSIASGLVAVAAMQRPWPPAVALVAISALAPILWREWPLALAVAAAWLGGSIAGHATARARAALVVAAVWTIAASLASWVSPGPAIGGDRLLAFLLAGAMALAGSLRPFESARPARRLLVAAAFAAASVAGAALLARSVPWMASGTPQDTLPWAAAVVLLLVAPQLQPSWVAIAAFVGATYLYALQAQWFRNPLDLLTALIVAIVVATVGAAASRLPAAKSARADAVAAATVTSMSWHPWLTVAAVLSTWAMLLTHSVRVWGGAETDILRTVLLTTLATFAIRPARFGADTFAPLVLGLGIAWLSMDARGRMGPATSDDALRAAVFASIGFAWARFVPDAPWVSRAGFLAVVALFAIPLVGRVRSGSPTGGVCFALVPVALSAVVHSEIRPSRAIAIATTLVLAQHVLSHEVLSRGWSAFRLSAETGYVAAVVACVSAVVLLACAARRARWMTAIPRDHAVFTDARAPESR